MSRYEIPFENSSQASWKALRRLPPPPDPTLPSPVEESFYSTRTINILNKIAKLISGPFVNVLPVTARFKLSSSHYQYRQGFPFTNLLILSDFWKIQFFS